MFPKKIRVIYEPDTNVDRLLTPGRVLGGADIRRSKLASLLSLTFRSFSCAFSPIQTCHLFIGRNECNWAGDERKMLAEYGSKSPIWQWKQERGIMMTEHGMAFCRSADSPQYRFLGHPLAIWLHSQSSETSPTPYASSRRQWFRKPSVR